MIRFDFIPYGHSDFWELVLQDGHLTPSFIAVTAVASLADVNHNSAYNEMLDISFGLKCMPDNKRCIFKFLRKYHFYRPPGLQRHTTVFRFLKKMRKRFRSADCALVMHTDGRLFAVIPEDGTFITELRVTSVNFAGASCSISDFDIKGVFIHWADGKNHSFAICCKPKISLDNGMRHDFF